MVIIVKTNCFKVYILPSLHTTFSGVLSAHSCACLISTLVDETESVGKLHNFNLGAVCPNDVPLLKRISKKIASMALIGLMKSIL